jgi:hypothetical protein
MVKLIDIQEQSIWNDSAFIVGGVIGFLLAVTHEMSEAAMNQIDEIEPFLQVALEIGAASILAACLSKTVAVCGQRILRRSFQRRCEKAAS